MARQKAESKQDFKEFQYDGKEFRYTGRIWPESKKVGDKVDITNMTLTLNGVLTIKGCKLMQSDKNTWIAFPSYQAKDKTYSSYVYTDKEFSEAELDKVAEAIEGVLK